LAKAEAGKARRRSQDHGVSYYALASYKFFWVQKLNAPKQQARTLLGHYSEAVPCSPCSHTFTVTPSDSSNPLLLPSSNPSVLIFIVIVIIIIIAINDSSPVEVY
jgi:hypothetical protein